MEKSRVFDIINKINSVLFLLLMLGVAAMMIFSIIMSSLWQDRRAVHVVQDGKVKKKVELILGNINNVAGHDVRYVKLYTRARGGSFSSSSGGGETRNVLFFTGKELQSHWLYEKHDYLIDVFSELNIAEGSDTGKVKSKAKAIFIETIKQDTDGNGKLDDDDLITVSLARPDGTNVTDIETGVQSVIDYDLLPDKESLLLLFQKDNKVIIKKYSLSTFKVESEKVINEIAGTL